MVDISAGPHRPPADVAAARRWADRLERAPWRWLATPWLLVIVVVWFVGLAGGSAWWRYSAVADGGKPLLACHSTEREVQYEVRWQWLPPGMVCDHADGSSEYAGL